MRLLKVLGTLTVVCVGFGLVLSLAFPVSTGTAAEVIGEEVGRTVGLFLISALISSVVFWFRRRNFAIGYPGLGTGVAVAPPSPSTSPRAPSPDLSPPPKPPQITRAAVDDEIAGMRLSNEDFGRRAGRDQVEVAREWMKRVQKFCSAASSSGKLFDFASEKLRLERTTHGRLRELVRDFNDRVENSGCPIDQLRAEIAAIEKKLATSDLPKRKTAAPKDGVR